TAERLRALLCPLGSHRRAGDPGRVPDREVGLMYLSIMTLAPLVGAIVVGCLPRSRGALAKVIALVVSLGVLGVAIAAWAAFRPGGARLQLTESWTWIPAWGARISFGADGIALVMLALIALLVPLVIIASWHHAEHDSRRSVPAFFA